MVFLWYESQDTGIQYPSFTQILLIFLKLSLPYFYCPKLAPIARLNGLFWFVSFGVSVPAILDWWHCWSVMWLSCCAVCICMLYYVFVLNFSITFVYILADNTNKHTQLCENFNLLDMSMFSCELLCKFSIYSFKSDKWITIWTANFEFECLLL